MIQIKTFKGLEHEHELLDETVNTWIRENNARVHDVKLVLAPQSKLPANVLRQGTSSDLMVLVTYDAN